jgi:murein peptide amidase A
MLKVTGRSALSNCLVAVGILAISCQSVQAQPDGFLAASSLPLRQRLNYQKLLGIKTSDVRPGGRTVVVVRGLNINGQLDASSDTLVVFSRSGDSDLQAEEFESSARASLATPDPFLIRPGTYMADPTGEGTWRLRNSFGSFDLGVWLDADRNGEISSSERTLTESRSDLRISNQASVGVVTSIAPNRLEQFQSTIGPDTSFKFIVMEASQLHPVSTVAEGCPEIPDKRLSVAQRFNAYQRILMTKTGPVMPGKTYLLGLRGLAPDGERHDSADNQGAYDDTYVLLRRTIAGQPELFEFRGSTHAGTGSDSAAPAAGVAQIRPGYYIANPDGYHHARPCWHVFNQQGTDRIPCWRDADADGSISSDERAYSEAQRHAATYILIHDGLSDAVCSSIGCLTMDPETYRRFCEVAGRSHRLELAMVDANQPINVRTQIYTLGYSVQNKPIHMFELGSGPRTALYFATIHGDEPAGTDLLKRLKSHFEKNPDLLNGWTVRIIPCVNPDATGLRRTNSRGVDLNRNFPAYWQRLGSPSAQGEFSGPSALSEPEAKALKAAVLGQYPGPAGRPQRILSIHQIRGLESGRGYLDGDGPDSVKSLLAAMEQSSEGAFSVKKIADSAGRVRIPGSFGTWVSSSGIQIPTVTYELSHLDQGASLLDANWQNNAKILLQFLTTP